MIDVQYIGNIGGTDGQVVDPHHHSQLGRYSQVWRSDKTASFGDQYAARSKLTGSLNCFGTRIMLKSFTQQESLEIMINFLIPLPFGAYVGGVFLLVNQFCDGEL